jgi:hypothetical protein
MLIGSSYHDGSTQYGRVSPLCRFFILINFLPAYLAISSLLFSNYFIASFLLDTRHLRGNLPRRCLAGASQQARAKRQIPDKISIDIYAFNSNLRFIQKHWTGLCSWE